MRGTQTRRPRCQPPSGNIGPSQRVRFWLLRKPPRDRLASGSACAGGGAIRTPATRTIRIAKRGSRYAHRVPIGFSGGGGAFI
jgi:hypothetical protein